MCKVSNKLKFCTCEKDFPLHETHYWELEKRTGESKIFVGTTHINKSDGEILDLNKNTILKRLEEKDCFDFDYIPKIEDKLNIYFLIDDKTKERMIFKFVYTENGWIAKKDGGVETMEWMEDIVSGKLDYSTVKKGKLKNVFE